MDNQKTKELYAQIERERQKMINCDHNFGKAVYDPYTKMEPYGIKLEGHGSDVYSVPEGYSEVEKPRWKRVCTKCGYEQFTEKTETVVVSSSTQPKF
jgi:hypothetical protein